MDFIVHSVVFEDMQFQLTSTWGQHTPTKVDLINDREEVKQRTHGTVDKHLEELHPKTT